MEGKGLYVGATFSPVSLQEMFNGNSAEFREREIEMEKGGREMANVNSK